jgi:predicted ABC-type ATPase
MHDQPSPTIYVLAGPNGAGKTSLYQYEALAVPRLNGDSLYQQGLAVQEVEASLRQQLEQWTTQRLSFVIETNAASERDYKLLSALKTTGYHLELRYVGLESVAVCQKRVAQRVLEGGHDVPLALIQQRYTNGLSLLKQHYRIFDRIQLYDNTGTEARQVAEVRPGYPLQPAIQLAAWATPVLAHIAKMETIYNKLST